MADSDRAWQKWGEMDPFYGVLTDEKYRSQAVESNRDVFYDSGEEYIASRLAKIERHLGAIHKGSALDFGCGVGRLVFPLARRFDRVTGVDISEGMLSEARRQAMQLGYGNTTFVASDDHLTQATGQYDFVTSYIVLQHIPVSRGMAIIDQLLGRLADAGTVNLHFSIDRSDSTLQKVRYWLQ